MSTVAFSNDDLMLTRSFCVFRELFDRDRDESQRLSVLKNTHKDSSGLLAKLQTEENVSAHLLAVCRSSRALPTLLSLLLPHLTVIFFVFSPVLWVTPQTSREDNSSKK